MGDLFDSIFNCVSLSDFFGNKQHYNCYNTTGYVGQDIKQIGFSGSGKLFLTNLNDGSVNQCGQHNKNRFPGKTPLWHFFS